MRRIRKQERNRVSRRGAGQGGANKPPARDELDTVQHPNSKSRLTGFEVLRRRNSLQEFAALPSCDIHLRCDTVILVAELLFCSPQFLAESRSWFQESRSLWNRNRAFDVRYSVFCSARLHGGVQTSSGNAGSSTQIKTRMPTPISCRRLLPTAVGSARAVAFRRGGDISDCGRRTGTPRSALGHFCAFLAPWHTLPAPLQSRPKRKKASPRLSTP